MTSLFFLFAVKTHSFIDKTKEEFIMSILNKMLSVISIKKKEKKSSIIKDVMDKPEEFVLEAFIENDEIVVKIKRKGSN